MQMRDIRIRVYGRFRRLRARFPWSRPKTHGEGGTMSNAEDEKRRAFEQVANDRETECCRWFSSRFRGRFSLAEPSIRPVARLIFTNEAVPFKERGGWMSTIGIDWVPSFYRSTDVPDWAFKDNQWPYGRRQFILTFAARRRDAAREPTKGESGEGNWYLTQRFSTEQASLIARYAVHALLSLYSERLAKLRDGVRARRRPRRPVKDARELDDYLTTDGIDVATIASDVGNFTMDLRRFRWNVPEYAEDQEDLPDAMRQADPMEFVPGLCSRLSEQAARLMRDTQNTAENIRGSAELKQAIANTRLQRTVMVVGFAALIVAIIGIFLAAGSQAGARTPLKQPTHSAPTARADTVHPRCARVPC
jgi:hypothetical protein